MIIGALICAVISLVLAIISFVVLDSIPWLIASIVAAVVGLILVIISWVGSRRSPGQDSAPSVDAPAEQAAEQSVESTVVPEQPTETPQAAIDQRYNSTAQPTTQSIEPAVVPVETPNGVPPTPVRESIPDASESVVQTWGQQPEQSSVPENTESEHGAHEAKE